MASRSHKSVNKADARLRARIVGAYQRAQHIVMAGAAPSSTDSHAAIAAYDKARDHLRADIARASALFPDADALLSWLLDDLPDHVLAAPDRANFALVVRTISQEAEGTGRPADGERPKLPNIKEVA